MFNLASMSSLASFKGYFITFFMALTIGLGMGGWGGVKFTESKVLAAQAETQRIQGVLDKLSDAAESAKTAFEQSKKVLESQVEQAQIRGQEALANAAKSFQSYRVVQARNLASKSSEITLLKRSIQTNTSTLSTLRVDLEAAKTESEKSSLKARILEEENSLIKSQTRAQGLDCLTVPVPQEYLDALSLT